MLKLHLKSYFGEHCCTTQFNDLPDCFDRLQDCPEMLIHTYILILCKIVFSVCLSNKTSDAKHQEDLLNQCTKLFLTFKTVTGSSEMAFRFHVKSLH